MSLGTTCVIAYENFAFYGYIIELAIFWVQSVLIERYLHFERWSIYILSFTLSCNIESIHFSVYTILLPIYLVSQVPGLFGWELLLSTTSHPTTPYVIPLNLLRDLRSLSYYPPTLSLHLIIFFMSISLVFHFSNL